MTQAPKIVAQRDSDVLPSFAGRRGCLKAVAAAAILSSGWSAPAHAVTPYLATRPRLKVKVGVLPYTSWSSFFVARDLGYFDEVGLDVDFFSAWTVTEQLPLHTEGDVPIVGGVGFKNYEWLSRRAPMKVVADLQSGGRTAKSRGNNALVVRRDLWESGAIRQPKDLLGRTVGTQSGPGGILHIMGVRWLESAGLDTKAVRFPHQTFSDVTRGFADKTVEAGFIGEPDLSAALAAGNCVVLATQEEMYPNIQVCWLQYWSEIDRLGPMLGERFMVAFLKGARDYVDAFEYGRNLEQIVGILTKNTLVTKPEEWLRSKYAYIDPDGRPQRDAMIADAKLLHGIGRISDPIDLGLSHAFDDRYRRFAVDYLQPYKPRTA